MNIQQYYNSIKEIVDQREKLNELEKQINEEAHREGLFSFELKELITELKSISVKPINIADVKISMKVPDYCKDIESVKARLKNQRAIMSTFIFACGGFTLSSKIDENTKLSDGTSIWEHISISKGKNPFGQRLLNLDKKAQQKVMFYIYPNSDLLKNTTISIAVANILSRREKQQSKQDLEK